MARRLIGCPVLPEPGSRRRRCMPPTWPDTQTELARWCGAGWAAGANAMQETNRVPDRLDLDDQLAPTGGPDGSRGPAVRELSQSSARPADGTATGRRPQPPRSPVRSSSGPAAARAGASGRASPRWLGAAAQVCAAHRPHGHRRQSLHGCLLGSSLDAAGRPLAPSCHRSATTNGTPHLPCWCRPA